MISNVSFFQKHVNFQVFLQIITVYCGEELQYHDHNRAQKHVFD